MSTFYDGSGNSINFGAAEVPDSVKQLLSFDDWPTYYGYIVGTQQKWSGVDTPGISGKVISVSGGESIVIRNDANSKNGMISVVTEFSTPVQGAAAPALATGMSYNATFTSLNGMTLPADARYLIIQTDGATSSSCAPTTLMIDGLDYVNSVRQQVYELHYNNGIKWVQFGDSITEGYYSYLDGDNNPHYGLDRSVVWPVLVSEHNHWNFTNMGAGGQGWKYKTGDVGNPSFVRVKAIADYSKYNLVTFAYGVNDWKGSAPMGSLSDSYTYSEGMTPSTVVESMRYCFDYIASKNPKIKMIVITPFNLWKQGGNTYGVYDDCYARGTQHNGVTLDEFADLIKSVCDEYGIEYIDMTRFSCINRSNIKGLLLDGIHPSIDCHALLARELATKIHFS